MNHLPADLSILWVYRASLNTLRGKIRAEATQPEDGLDDFNQYVRVTME